MGGFNFHPFFKWQAKSLETGGFLWWLSVYHESSGATFGCEFFLCFSPCIYGISVACFVPRFLSAAIPAFLQTSFRRYSSDDVWQHFAGVNFCHGFCAQSNGEMLSVL